MTTRVADAERVPAAPSRAAQIASALLVAGLLALIYHRTLDALWTTWVTNDTYSHGPLIPLVALGLAVWRRDALAALRPVPQPLGLLVVAAGCAMQLAGIRGDVLTLQGWSLLVVLFGAVLTVCGGPIARVLAVPIGYLVFMLTFPPLLVNQLSFALKEVAVALSTRIAEALGVVMQRDGMVLTLATGELRIEHPCSGLRSLLALIATGALFAITLPAAARWKQALMLLSALPIAILANTLRLTLLILVAHYGSVSQAAGRVHDLSGYLLYGFALAGLMLVRSWLVPPHAPAAAPSAAARRIEQALRRQTS